MHTALLLLFFLFPAVDKTPSDATSSEKIQTIDQLQDRRRGTDHRLAVFLSDSDAAVRKRATMACASIQDTLLLPLLLTRLQDENAVVREAAAFALGQTGSLLSPTGRNALEKKCLNRFSQAGAPPRLMEEIGKFGTAAGLSRLLLLAPTIHSATEHNALILGVARFAIRGIMIDDATHFLDSLAGQPSTVSWQVIYALQRLAPRPRGLVHAFLPLTDHTDPLVRMYAATLLGKLGDTLGSSAVLARLSAGDPDWRVRVNAVKALGALGPSPSSLVMKGFIESFSDTNEHVALTSLAVFGQMMKTAGKLPHSAEPELWKLAENSKSVHSIRRQAEAIATLARIERSTAFARLSGIRPRDEWLYARYICALGLTGDTLALPILQKNAEHKNAFVASSSLEGLQSLGKANATNPRVIQAVIKSAIARITSKDISILSTAASILADSLFRSPRAAPALIQALGRLQVPDDVEAMQAVIQALGSLHDAHATKALVPKLHSSDRTVAESAASALEEITGRSYRDSIHVETNTASLTGDSAFLSDLPDTVLVRVQTSAGPVSLELYPRIAPYTVTSFLKLAMKQFFDGTRFHRVVPNFVVQGGDPRGDGWGGPGYSIRSEFSLLRYERGMLGMASAGKDTEGSQFFVTHSPQPHLDGRYTIFGMVRDGMEVVDRLQVGDVITHIRVETPTIVGH